MRARTLIATFMAAAAVSCSRPSSYEPFMTRERAEYGDTYSFILDNSDSTVTYSLDFYTRLERPAFGSFPADSLVLDLRWIAPSDSILIDTLVLRLENPVDSSYYTRSVIGPYSSSLDLPERGDWRLKAKIVNDSPQVRGLGVIFKRN